jgi:hypothetical protein
MRLVSNPAMAAKRLKTRKGRPLIVPPLCRRAFGAFCGPAKTEPNPRADAECITALAETFMALL